MSNVGDMLAVARKAKGLTQEQLAERLGVKQPTIGRYEAGERVPDDAALERLAAELDVTPRLLEQAGREVGAIAVDAHMRRQATTKASQWRLWEARLNLTRAHSRALFEEISILSQGVVPTFPLDIGMTPEIAAGLVRAQWRMPIGPVSNLTRWLEAHGVLVFLQDFGTAKIDGLSQWSGDHPVMLINDVTPVDRMRLTMAHELGHLVLHSHEPSETMEQEANEFAAEFLMPAAAIKDDFRSVAVSHLLDMKREWGVSMAALFERAFHLGCATPAQRATFYKTMNARGWRRNEPGSESLAVETPALAEHISRALVDRGFTPENIASMCGYATVDACPFVPPARGLQLVQP